MKVRVRGYSSELFMRRHFPTRFSGCLRPSPWGYLNGGRKEKKKLKCQWAQETRSQGMAQKEPERERRKTRGSASTLPRHPVRTGVVKG